MKKPPSASVRPPIHTTQRVPIVSSKPRSGCGSGGGGAAAAAGGLLDVSDGAAGATDSTSGTMGGGVGAAAVEAGGRVCSNASNGVSGGGTGAAAAAGAVSIASSRCAQLRHLVHGLSREDQCDDRNHEREENRTGSSNIRPPGGRVRPLTGHVRSLVAIRECSFAR